MRRVAAVLGFLILSVACLSYAAGSDIPRSVIEKLYKKNLIKVPKKYNSLIAPVKINPRMKAPSLEELLDEYSVDKLSRTPLPSKDVSIHQVPIRRLFFMPFQAYNVKWSRLPDLNILVITDGLITLDELYRRLHNPDILSRNGNVFTLKIPLFIASKGGLIVSNSTLRLALDPGAPIMCAGRLYIVNSTLKAWDTVHNRFSPIKIPNPEYYYLYGVQPPRPYIIIIRGGKLRIVSSKIEGLGYRDSFATFGVGLKEWGVEKRVWLSPLLFLMLNPEGTEISSTGTKALLMLFTRKEKPSAVIVGNDIYNNYMGFYSSNAGKVAIIGNVFKGNFQYNLDPHDWSKGMLVAYNIFEGAHKAHGVVFSRYSKGIVLNNISIGNHGAGIMMDRQSESLIKGNIIFGNRLGGITLLESDNNSLTDNFIVRNGAYGIYVRNSLNAQITGNRLLRNEGSGAEVSVIDISYQTYRNLYVDPYHEASSAWMENNEFNHNLKCEIKSYFGGVGIYKNRFKFSFSLPFSGDLAPFTAEILKYQGRRPVVILGMGNKKLIKKSVPDPREAVLKIERRILKHGNREAEVAIGLSEFNLSGSEEWFVRKTYLNKSDLLRCGVRWFLRAARRGDVTALRVLGLILYSLTKYGTPMNREGVVMFSESSVLGDMHSMYILTLMPVMSGVSKEYINSAVREAIGRIRRGRLINCKMWEISPSCCYESIDDPKLRTGLSRFEKEFYLSGADNYVDFMNGYAKKFTDKAFFAKVLRIKKRMRLKNANFERFFKWQSEEIKKAGMMYLENSPEAVKFVNKILSIKKTWKLILQKSASGDFNALKPCLERRIRSINSFRAKGMKLNVKTLVNRYREVYFESR